MNKGHSPLNYFFLFLHHVSKLLKDGTQLHDRLFYIFHRIGSALYVSILRRSNIYHCNIITQQTNVCTII